MPKTDLIDRLFGLDGKVAVVTGGSRGIGLMITRGLLEAGCERVYICSRHGDECERAAADLAAYGECVALQADLSTLAGVEAFTGAVKEREKRLHILVNNAGAAWGETVDTFPESGWDKVMDLNLKALFFVTQRLLPELRAAATADDPARVINIGSIDGIDIPLTPNYPYSAAKAGVHMLTRHLGQALVKDRVHVNAIAPGLFPSKMTRFFFEGGLGEDVEKLVPAGRAGRFEDAAGAAIYLSAKASSFLTGAVIVVSGGQALVD